MFREKKAALRQWCMTHRIPYRLLIRWFRRRTVRGIVSARREGGVDGNMVLFSSYRMTAFNDNPYYICAALHALRPQTELVWLFRDVAAARQRFDIPDWVRCVQWETPEGRAALGRARVWVDNWRKPDYLPLSRGQVYLHAPHHDRSFKLGMLALKDRMYGHVLESRASMATSGSEFCREMLRLCYRYKGPTLDMGQPRNDILVRDDPADAARIREGLGVDGETRLLLYAPTFRDAEKDTGRRQRAGIDLTRALDALEATLGGRWLCLYRAHYFAAGLDVGENDGRLKDVSSYPETAELLRVADALISDYSCVAGDFALRGKPIWLYVADIDAYAQSRALYVRPTDTPFLCARSPDELDALIRRTTPELARRNCREVLDFYRTHETGRAAESAAKYIIEQLSDCTVCREKNRLRG